MQKHECCHWALASLLSCWTILHTAYCFLASNMASNMGATTWNCCDQVLNTHVKTSHKEFSEQWVVYRKSKHSWPCLLSISRQLSEENANLQEHVEKETEEKKRLSRTNEELLWKLQTVEPMSPVKLSPTSPTHIYRSSSGPPTPAKVSTVPRWQAT